MTFDWNDFLKFAEALNSNPDTPGPNEAALRSATSRAYYAAFHLVMNFAENEGFLRKRSGDDHKAIQSHFRDFKPIHKSRRRIALQLDRLYDHRHVADYRDSISRSPDSHAEQAIGMARIILNELESLKSV